MRDAYAPANYWDRTGNGLAVVALGYDEAALRKGPEFQDCRCYAGTAPLGGGRFVLQGDSTIHFRQSPYGGANEGLGAYLSGAGDTAVSIPIYIPGSITTRGVVFREVPAGVPTFKVVLGGYFGEPFNGDRLGLEAALAADLSVAMAPGTVEDLSVSLGSAQTTGKLLEVSFGVASRSPASVLSIVEEGEAGSLFQKTELFLQRHYSFTVSLEEVAVAETYTFSLQGNFMKLRTFGLLTNSQLSTYLKDDLKEAYGLVDDEVNIVRADIMDLRIDVTFSVTPGHIPGGTSRLVAPRFTRTRTMYDAANRSAAITGVSYVLGDQSMNIAFSGSAAIISSLQAEWLKLAIISDLGHVLGPSATIQDSDLTLLVDPDGGTLDVTLAVSSFSPEVVDAAAVALRTWGLGAFVWLGVYYYSYDVFGILPAPQATVQEMKIIRLSFDGNFADLIGNADFERAVLQDLPYSDDDIRQLSMDGSALVVYTYYVPAAYNDYAEYYTDALSEYPQNMISVMNILPSVSEYKSRFTGTFSAQWSRGYSIGLPIIGRFGGATGADLAMYRTALISDISGAFGIDKGRVTMLAMGPSSVGLDAVLCLADPTLNDDVVSLAVAHIRSGHIKFQAAGMLYFEAAKSFLADEGPVKSAIGDFVFRANLDGRFGLLGTDALYDAIDTDLSGEGTIPTAFQEYNIAHTESHTGDSIGIVVTVRAIDMEHASSAFDTLKNTLNIFPSLSSYNYGTLGSIGSKSIVQTTSADPTPDTSAPTPVRTVTASLSLSGTFTTLFNTNKEALVDTLRTDLAKTYGVDPSYVTIVSLALGSLKVVYRISNVTREAAALAATEIEEADTPIVFQSLNKLYRDNTGGDIESKSSTEGTETISVTVVGGTRYVLPFDIYGTGRLVRINLRRIDSGGVRKWVLVEEGGAEAKGSYRTYAALDTLNLAGGAPTRLSGTLTDSRSLNPSPEGIRYASAPYVASGKVLIYYMRGQPESPPLEFRTMSNIPAILQGVNYDHIIQINKEDLYFSFMIPSSGPFYLSYAINLNNGGYTVMGPYDADDGWWLSDSRYIRFSVNNNDLIISGEKTVAGSVTELEVITTEVVPKRIGDGRYSIELVGAGAHGVMGLDQFSVSSEAQLPSVKVAVEPSLVHYSVDLVSGGEVLWQYMGGSYEPLDSILLARGPGGEYVPYQLSLRTQFERVTLDGALGLYGIRLGAVDAVRTDLLLRVLPGGRREVLNGAMRDAVPSEVSVFGYGRSLNTLYRGNELELIAIGANGRLVYVSDPEVSLSFKCASLFGRGADLPPGNSKNAYDVARAWAGVAQLVCCCAPVSDADGPGIEYYVPSSFGLHEALRRVSTHPNIRRVLIYACADLSVAAVGGVTKNFLHLMPLPAVCGLGSSAQDIPILRVAPSKAHADVSVPADSLKISHSGLSYDAVRLCPLSVVMPGNEEGTTVSLEDMFESCGHGAAALGADRIMTVGRSESNLNWGGRYISQDDAFGVSVGSEASVGRSYDLESPPSSVALLLDNVKGGSLDAAYGVEYGPFTGPRGRVAMKVLQTPGRSPTAFRLANGPLVPLMVFASPGSANANYLRNRPVRALSGTCVAEQSRLTGAQVYTLEIMNTGASSAAGNFFVAPADQPLFTITDQPAAAPA